MNPVAQLSTTELNHERYHADGSGHLQVETISYPMGESPRELLEQIEAQALWPSFFKLVRRQPESWLLHLLPHLPNDQNYGTVCRVALLDLELSRETQLALLQEAPHWYWSAETESLLPQVINATCQLLAQPNSCDELSLEIETSQLTDLLEKLETIHQP